MPAPATAADLVELIRRSGVVDEPRLKAYFDSGLPMPPEPNKLASQMVREGLLTYFQAEQFLQGKWKRFTIGKYKVLERLGSGGMGQVFLCEHKLMRRRVAVKVLPTAKAEDQAALERFYREARAVAALDHPNLVRAYDIDQDETLHFLVMEYVDGASLQDLVKKIGPLSPLRAAHYVHQAAIGLDYAFQVASLIHRDIKPANILVDRSGIIKILDMGLARFFKDDQDVLTKKYDESVLGTADYLAPEQAMDSHGVDIRADIYSLGATFHYILTGFAPFPEGTVTQKLMWHQTKAPKPITAYRQDVPPQLLAVIEAMMSKDPDGRPQTPAHLAELLAPFTQTPIPPPADSELPQLSRAAQLAASGQSTGSTGKFSSSKVNKTASHPAQSGAGLASGGYARAAGSEARGSTPGGGTSVSFPAYRPASGGSPSTSAVVQPPVARNGGYTPPPNGMTATGEFNPYQAMMGQRLSADPHAYSTPAAPAAPTRKSGMGLLIAGVAVVLIGGLTAGGAWWYFNVGPGKKANAKAAIDEGSVRRLKVSQVPEQGEYRSVADALKKAARHDHIVLMDPVHQETLRLIASGDRDVTIESGLPGGRPVRWLPISEGSGQPLVTVTDFDGLVLKGIEFDGGGQLDGVVKLAGHCAGVKLEGITFKGFRQYAIRLEDVVADGGEQALRLLGCRAITTADADAAVQVITLSRPARNIVLRDCRWEGAFKAAISVQPSAVDVVIERNRFLRCNVGVRINKAAKEQFASVNVTSCTFAEVKAAAIEVEGPPLTNSKLAIEQNLFWKVPAILKTEGAIPYIAASHNVRDREVSHDGTLPTPAVMADYLLLSLDPAGSDGKFLRYGKDSPLMRLASGRGLVGVPPE